MHTSLAVGGDHRASGVVPKTMLIPWAEQISSWMTNTKTVVANHENQLTEETVLDSKIILITSGALYTAFRKGAKINLPPGKKTFDAKYVVPREGVALHPLFAFMKSRACAGRPAFSFVIHDEIHMRCNPRTWTGLITKVLSTHSPFRLGLTATPVTRDAGQMAHLCDALRMNPVILRSARAWVMAHGGQKKAAIQKSSVLLMHESNALDRCTKELLDLPPLRETVLEYEPRVEGKEAIEAHNCHLRRAKHVAHDLVKRESAPDSQKKTIEILSAMHIMQQTCFSPILAKHGAVELQRNKRLLRACVSKPSETLVLVQRAARHWQTHGHPKIVIYTSSTAMLDVMALYLSCSGCGENCSLELCK